MNSNYKAKYCVYRFICSWYESAYKQQNMSEYEKNTSSGHPKDVGKATTQNTEFSGFNIQQFPKDFDPMASFEQFSGLDFFLLIEYLLRSLLQSKYVHALCIQIYSRVSSTKIQLQIDIQLYIEKK